MPSVPSFRNHPLAHESLLQRGASKRRLLDSDDESTDDEEVLHSYHSDHDPNALDSDEQIPDITTIADNDDDDLIDDEDDDILHDSDDDGYELEQVFGHVNIQQRPQLPAEISAEVAGDEENDAELLRRLQQRHDQMMRNNMTSTTSDEINDFTEESQQRVTVTWEARREQALSYLSSLFLHFLEQTNTSLEILNKKEMEKGLPMKNTRRKNVEEPTQESSQEKVEAATEDEGIVGVSMRLRNRTTGDDQLTSFPDDPSIFLSSNKEPALHRMACILRIASLLYEAILTNSVTTKRDIYYKDVGLFKTQVVVDKLVDNMVASAELKRQDFNVCATSKGLVASSVLRVWMKSGEELSFSSTNASLIPPVERIDRIGSEQKLSWVLIVEKDAVFQHLCGARLLDDARIGAGILVTGKGYPDLATVQLLAMIRDAYAEYVEIAFCFGLMCESVTFHALVDADPHGLDILSVYTKGSKSTRYSHDYTNLALGARLEWLGVRASDWLDIGVRHDDLLQLTQTDVQKAKAMLRRSDIPAMWRRELAQMLHLDRKAEIQIIAQSASHSSRQEANSVLQAIFLDNVKDSAVVPRASGDVVNTLVEYIVRRLRECVRDK
ncbi:Spo11/DNA topoisomerase VI subunit A [Naematelia encephala]|uniref:DNA topoisomerase (ATP-hydrolyzing) n=1 Tax=Naematelia encephala TaxID=71784 RepID=A0A1Y2AH28_9TREE|nr:Spo11/DNA topoisomerase VI subunit A [Naematelia encephala]